MGLLISVAGREHLVPRYPSNAWHITFIAVPPHPLLTAYSLSHHGTQCIMGHRLCNQQAAGIAAMLFAVTKAALVRNYCSKIMDANLRVSNIICLHDITHFDALLATTQFPMSRSSKCDVHLN